MSEFKGLADSIAQDDPNAAAELLPLVYEELRKLAASRMAAEPPGHTLQPTALVHEAYLRLLGSHCQSWNGRGHFFAAASEAMRRILVEKARRRRRQKHGGGLARINLDQLDLASTSDDNQLLAVHEALNKLAGRDPLAAELIKLRFFAGLSHTEAAQALGIPERTAKRRWEYARAWLYDEFRQGK